MNGERKYLSYNWDLYYSKNVQFFDPPQNYRGPLVAVTAGTVASTVLKWCSYSSIN